MHLGQVLVYCYCCWYKFSKFKSRNPQILLNTTEARKPGETPWCKDTELLPGHHGNQDSHPTSTFTSTVANGSWDRCRMALFALSLSTSGLADARGCSSFVVTCNNINDVRRNGHTSPFTSRCESSQHSSTSTESLSAKPVTSTRQLRIIMMGTKSTTIEC